METTIVKKLRFAVDILSNDVTKHSMTSPLFEAAVRYMDEHHPEPNRSYTGDDFLGFKASQFPGVNFKPVEAVLNGSTWGRKPSFYNGDFISALRDAVVSHNWKVQIIFEGISEVYEQTFPNKNKKRK